MRFRVANRTAIRLVRHRSSAIVGLQSSDSKKALGSLYEQVGLRGMAISLWLELSKSRGEEIRGGSAEIQQLWAKAGWVRWRR
jgi:hypothetical protein